MVRISFSEEFKEVISKLDKSVIEKVWKQLEKIKQNPEVGKPMRNERKNTQELYVKPFRLSYGYLKDKDEVVILDLYHKKKQ